MGGAGIQLVSNWFRLGANDSLSESSQMPGWLLEMVTFQLIISGPNWIFVRQCNKSHRVCALLLEVFAVSSHTG